MAKIQGKGHYKERRCYLTITKTLSGIPVRAIRHEKKYNGGACIMGQIWVEPAQCWMERTWTKEGKATFQPDHITDFDLEL